MLVLEELDVTGPHEAVDHESNHPRQILADHSVLIQILFTPAAVHSEFSGYALANPLPGQANQAPVLSHAKTAPGVLFDGDGGELGQTGYQVQAMGVVEDLSGGHQVLLNAGGALPPLGQQGHKVRQVLVVDLGQGHVTKERQDVVVNAAAKY
jgi:hypothetical protein